MTPEEIREQSINEATKTYYDTIRKDEIAYQNAHAAASAIYEANMAPVIASFNQAEASARKIYESTLENIERIYNEAKSDTKNSP